MINELIHGDYKDYASGLNYDYVFTSPPDFEEIGASPSDVELYQNFLLETISLLRPNKNLITIGFTDRKFNGTIVPKHSILTHVMQSLGYKLVTHKIWLKSLKVDLFRLTYGNVLTFSKGKAKQNMDKSFKPDVWNDGYGKYKGFSYGMPVTIPEKCILNYTDIGDVVYDPFMGSGTTAVAAHKNGRGYIGTELNKEYWELSVSRMNDELNKLDGFL